MSQISKTRVVPKAQQSKRNAFNFDKQVVATSDFGVMSTIENKIMFPGDKFDVKVDHFTRLMPMPAPTFGRITEKMRAFFVPIRILFKDWEDFITNNETFSRTGGQTAKSSAKCPQIPLSDLWYSFVNSSAHCTVSNESDYDFWLWVITNFEEEERETRYYKLTPYGRHVLKNLNGLGYEMPRVIANRRLNSIVPFSEVQENYSNFNDYEQVSYQPVSLLPLLAFWRAYIDWIIPARFIRSNHSILLSHLNSIYKGVGLNEEGVYTDDLVSLLYLPYSYANSDYFGSAFFTPYGYENDMASDTVFGLSFPQAETLISPNDSVKMVKPVGVSRKGGYQETQSGLGLTTSPNQGAVTMSGWNGEWTDDEMQISALTVRTLGALQDMVNRGKLAGSKIQDYLRVTYGIEPDSSALDISTYLGCHKNDIMIGDVMSNSDTFDQQSGSGAYLGQYAGKALGGSQGDTFTYSAEEHGFFFITYELEVKSSYVQGLRPEVTAVDRFDFFQPEFDGLDVDAIAMRELYTSSLFNRANPNFDPSVSPWAVFGYTPRYSKYKVNFDTVLGDFRRHSVNEGLDSWFFARNFEMDQYKKSDWYAGISEKFLRQFSATSSDDYDKIFMTANNLVDHFYIVFNLKFDAYRHMKSLDTPLEFEENGDTVKVDSQGSVE